MSVFFSTLKSKILEFSRSTDLVLLLFLILVLHVSLAVKLTGVIFIYALRPDFKFKIHGRRLPLFYLLILIFSVIEYLFNFNRGFNYTVLALLAFSFWACSFLIIHQLKLAIEKQGILKVERALMTFFIINAAVSVFNLLNIIIEIKDINPYTFDGLGSKYSASTGDYISGIMGDISTTNMIINAFGIFYFLYKKKYFLSLLCFLVATFTTSNLGNAILLVFFAGIVIFDRSKFNKSVILCYTTFIVVFIIKISPSNLNYLNYKSKELLKLNEKPVKVTFEDHSEKDKLITSYINKKHRKIEVKQSDKQIINKLLLKKKAEDNEKKRRDDSSYVMTQVKTHNKFVLFYQDYYGDTLTTLNKGYYNLYAGKQLSFLETISFIKESPRNFIIGAGPGNFSSKLAFKTSNIGTFGKYIEKLKYVAPEFKENHLKLTLSYYLKSSTEHSIINFPNSVFNQLLGEYGIIGLTLFFAFYVWFYLKKIKALSFGKILLPMFLMFLLTDYWFECFSIAIIFELMMFIDLAKGQQPNNPENA